MQQLTVRTTIDVVAVKIVSPCPSGRSWTDWRARAKAIAPLSPEQETPSSSSLNLNVFIWWSDEHVWWQYIPLYQRASWYSLGIWEFGGRAKFNMYAQEKTFAALQDETWEKKPSKAPNRLNKFDKWNIFSKRSATKSDTSHAHQIRKQ